MRLVASFSMQLRNIKLQDDTGIIEKTLYVAYYELYSTMSSVPQS